MNRMYIASNGDKPDDKTTVFVAKNMEDAKARLKEDGLDDFTIFMEGDEDTEVMVIDEAGHVEHLAVEPETA